MKISKKTYHQYHKFRSQLLKQNIADSWQAFINIVHYAHRNPPECSVITEEVLLRLYSFMEFTNVAKAKEDIQQLIDMIVPPK